MGRRRLGVFLEPSTQKEWEEDKDFIGCVSSPLLLKVHIQMSSEAS